MIELCDPGELYTWGKGRYGRLGHGDSEDQLRPKLVESLLGYRVIDVACGELTNNVLYDIRLIDGASVFVTNTAVHATYPPCRSHLDYWR